MAAMTKWPVQNPTHRTTQQYVKHQDATDKEKNLMFLCYSDFPFFLLKPSFYVAWLAVNVLFIKAIFCFTIISTSIMSSDMWGDEFNIYIFSTILEILSNDWHWV